MFGKVFAKNTGPNSSIVESNTLSAPILSVITAIYNEELYLHEAITSVLTQTYGDFEYIIVDDASTDRTPEILSSINDRRVKVIVNETNQGRGAARNRALEQAYGEYIAIMDADDISHPQRFELQLEYLKANPHISYLGTGVRMVNKENGKFIADEIKPLTDGAIRWMLLHKSPIIHPTSIGKRNSIKRAGNYDPQLLRCQDVDLMRKIAHAGKFANIPEILYTYRVRSGSNLQEMYAFGKPYVQRVYTTYMRDLLDGKFEPVLLNFVWSVRYPLQDDLPDTDQDDFIFNAVTVLFALYHEFQTKYELSADELKFIQQDLLLWISKIANKSKNYTMLLEIFLKGENLSNLKHSNSLVKAWLKSLLHKRR